MAHNIGAAIGPIIGAAVVVVSKDVIFLITSGTMLFYTILMLLFLKETKPKNIMIHKETHKQSIRFTLRVVIRDRIFLFYIVTESLYLWDSHNRKVCYHFILVMRIQ